MPTTNYQHSSRITTRHTNHSHGAPFFGGGSRRQRLFLRNSFRLVRNTARTTYPLFMVSDTRSQTTAETNTYSWSSAYGGTPKLNGVSR
ncbi:MAG: hypothetical protein LBG05_10320 [Treponema sp.]|nr:hypothetical protein [Treponema sp.]